MWVEERGKEVETVRTKLRNFLSPTCRISMILMCAVRFFHTVSVGKFSKTNFVSQSTRGAREREYTIILYDQLRRSGQHWRIVEGVG